MEQSGMSKKEYLKKYLSGGEKKKKKKKSTQSLIIKSRIVDDDIDLKNMKPIDDDELEIYDLAEEAPQIVGIIDERPAEVRLMSEFRSTKKWKIVTDEFGIEDVKITAIDRTKSDDGSPKREKEISIEIRKTSDKKQSDSADRSPPRSKENSQTDGDAFTTNKVITQEVDSDASPPRNSAKDNQDYRALKKTIKKEKEDLSSKKTKEVSDASSKKSNRRDDDSDPSPPRKSKKTYDSDASPPRKSKNYDSDQSPPRKSKKKYDSDPSPPRKSRKNYDSDASPPRKPKKSYDSDASPPRKSRRNYDSDASPPRKSRTNYDSDASPPRRSEKKAHERSLDSGRRDHFDSSRHRKSRHKNDSDSSPPRRRRDDSDPSPPRKTTTSTKTSNSHHKKRQEETRRRSRSSSPGKYSNHKSEKYGLKLSRSHESREKKEKKSSQLEKTLSGKKAGLQSAEEMRKESEKLRQKEKETFEKMSDDLTGKNATAIVRNRKTGRRHDPKEEARKKREMEEKEAEKIAQYAVWGKGVKQVEDRENKLKDDLYEMSKPLARYKDDKDLEEMLKNQEREGDPMLDYIRRKKKSEAGLSTPEYEGNYPPNRYDIKPGHKWDGVDRSNGYEKKWFDEQNERKAREEEAFKWSTIDM